MNISMALALISVLFVIALFPVLRHVSPRAPTEISVDGSQTVKLEKNLLRYAISGPKSSEGILFLHGFNNQLSAWSAVWPHLKNCGTQVRMDIPGYCGSVIGSNLGSNAYSLPAQAERVIAFIDALGFSRVTLVGVSMGGSLSAWIASNYPERVKGLILLAPSGYPGSLQYGGIYGKLVKPGMLNRLATQIASSGLYRSLYPDSRALQALSVTASYGDPWAEALGKIKTNSWVLWSRGDFGVHFNYAEAVAKTIPSSTFVPLAANAGHDIPGNRPELIAKLACLVHKGTPHEQIMSEIKNILSRNGDS